MKIIEKPHSFAPRTLIFKIQWYMRELELHKNSLRDEFFKPKKHIFCRTMHYSTKKKPSMYP